MFQTFRALLVGAFVALGCMAAAGGADAQSYLPVGPQTAVPVATVTAGGWTECFRETYTTNGTPLTTATGACGATTRLMMACRTIGSNTLTVLAQGPTADVTTVTTGNTGVTNSNGVAFYYSGIRSWGFAKQGDAVNLNTCDVMNSGTGAGADRMCWHTGANTLQNGYRCGTSTSGGSLERVLYAFNAAPNPVPTLSEWAMILLGVLLAGIAILYVQRRQTAI